MYQWIVLNVESWINNELYNCLQRLQTKSIYGLLVHNTENLLGKHGDVIINTLNKLKSLKLIKKLGISIYDPTELDHLMNLMEINIVQAPLNLIDRRIETSGWLSKLYKNGIEVHTRSSFLQGLLLMSRAEIPSKFNKWSKMWNLLVKGIRKK